MATNARKKRPSGQQTPAGLLASAARTVGTVAGGENRLMPEALLPAPLRPPVVQQVRPVISIRACTNRACGLFL